MGGGRLSAAPIDNIDIELGKLEQIQKTDVTAAQKQIDLLTPRIGSFTSEQATRLLISSAISKIFSGKFDDALAYLDKAEAKISAPRYLSQIYNYRAVCLIGLRRYRDALIVMGRNLALLEKVDDPVEKRDSYFRIANLYDELGAYDEMGLYASRILDLAEEQKDTKARCYGIFLLAMSQSGRGLLKQANESLQEGLGYCTQHGYSLIVPMINKGLADTASMLGDNHTAQKYFRISLAQYQKFNFATEIISTSALLAKVDLALGDKKEAEFMALNVLEAKDDSSNMEARSEALKVLADVAAGKSEFEKAFAYQQQYLDISGKLFDENRVKALAYQAAHFSANEREQELKLLNKERELLLTREMLREKEHNNMVMFVSLLSVVMVMLAGFAYWGWQQKQRYMRLSRHDLLTGIYNRAAAQSMGDISFVQAMSQNRDFSVLVLALDNFKVINDSFGFGTGDWMLCRIAETLSPLLPRKSIFARNGGQQFLVILPDATAKDALSLADKLRLAIADISSNRSGHQFTATASVGVSCRTEDDLSLEPLINRAHHAMNVAKDTGGNTVGGAPETQPDLLNMTEAFSN
ncbi:GGDEF domain-containing protein [Shewanella yunxiaonensis]|uniref:diguanylate cyclase n=1 Tax=Shewanella yunxiaonensis TaxID=2829809 RepID=A0ABX7YQ75_9GAMM|nr:MULTISPECIES: GGDEF domain-containing protein [Shewanella]MDF0534813.1 GGDEF domain-containing protein [Shewanella sp. A32]QUN04769.1 GGDEF domain-containing protein [Shewanella yunxiaonensis]